MSSSTTQQNKPEAKVQEPINEDHKKILNKKRNINKKIDGIVLLRDSVQAGEKDPTPEQKKKIDDLKNQMDEQKKIEKELKDFLKGIKDAEAKSKHQLRENEKLISQGRKDAVQAVANMIAIHTFQDCGHSDLVPEELGEGINHFRDCINRVTLRTQNEPQSNWKEHRQCFVNMWTKLGSASDEIIPNTSISYGALSSGVEASLNSGVYPELVAKQKKERNKKHKKAEAEVVQEEVVEQAAAEVHQAVDPVAAAEAQELEDEIAKAEQEEVQAEAESAVEEQKEAAGEATEAVAENENKVERDGENKRGRGRGRGGNRGRGEHRPRGNYYKNRENKDEDGFETVKENNKADNRGRGRGRGRGFYERRGGDNEEGGYRGRGGNRGDRGSRGDRGDRGDRGGRARPTNSRKGQEFAAGKQVSEATAEPTAVAEATKE